MRVSVGFDGQCAAQTFLLVGKDVARSPARVLASVVMHKRINLSKKMIIDWNFKFEIDYLIDELKYDCHPHYTHLQVAPANAQPKLAKECNFANASLAFIK